ncbi:DUF262 domain-containing protein [Solwaraspora sp. WMMD937]|uniref:DUF262 domain-containing protein n=1 Tax=Solwaraspora sp. WMMD937 TaxID=3016090 RepID=UPI00249B9390|nr:DUF262 domain-containing protein [Solwaraspora sp. WMMD937]WFE20953.1 DUF262 domain-containing protein [Solwaraspora sp. WMMD937]
MATVDRSIEGGAKTINEVLANKKYEIDYYQREYRWESKQITELVADLTTKFLDLYDAGHVRKDVANYPGYFLGSIIISQKENRPFIVDGQQRLTSLTLLLTFLRRLQADRSDKVDVDPLIYSEMYGEKSFNLDVGDRTECMKALFGHGAYNPKPDDPTSVHTLVARYQELEGLFPEELRRKTLPYFIDWLKDRVQLVQITAYDDDDAYAIFETMNDRGLRLTPADMLKGYLLANVEDGEPRTKANDLWRRRLRELDDKSEDASSDFLKNWLRSQYSTRIRERKRNARPENWDRIGTEFHRWLRGDSERIGLTSRNAFYDFIHIDFDFYSHQYERIIEATRGSFDPTSPLRFIRYNSDHRFTLQDQLLLAPLNIEDDLATINRKLELVGRFADILLARRIWNFRTTAYSTMQYAMFTVMRGIRRLGVEELGQFLHTYLTGVAETFDSNEDLYVHQQNRSQIHKILARITDYITVGSNQASNYIELTNDSNVKYEVEHVWADHASRHIDEFTHEADFARHRNRIGDLLLLPKQFNASYGDDTYVMKRPRYYSQNLLAASLDPQTYEKNPGFLAFIKSSGLPFRAHEEFKAADIIERGKLYQAIAKHVWNPDDLLAVANGGS